MKILYITLTNGHLFHGILADYMSDLLFHGLYELYRDSVVDIPFKEHLNKNYPDTKLLWGKGFTYSNLIDRDFHHSQLKTNEFDLIIISIHHTRHFYKNQNYEDIKNLCSFGIKVAVVDGNDLQDYDSRIFELTPYYFKREIADNADERLIPINFAIPECKLNFDQKQTKDFAFIYPGSCEPYWPQDSRKTHIYDNEKSYYADYGSSRFAFTCKKGGWDCMRHYEILANGCVPIFTDIENCPRRTLTNLDKYSISSVKCIKGLNIATTSEHPRIFGGHHIKQFESTIDENKFDIKAYYQIRELLCEDLRKNLTTKALAEYFLEKIDCHD